MYTYSNHFLSFYLKLSMKHMSNIVHFTYHLGSVNTVLHTVVDRRHMHVPHVREQYHMGRRDATAKRRDAGVGRMTRKRRPGG